MGVAGDGPISPSELPPNPSSPLLFTFLTQLTKSTSHSSIAANAMALQAAYPCLHQLPLHREFHNSSWAWNQLHF